MCYSLQAITIEEPLSYLCIQVPCIAGKKLNRSILTESIIFCKCIIPIRKEYALLLLTTTLMKSVKKRSYFCA